LFDFYTALDGQHWDWYNITTKNAAWNFTTDANPCSDNWQGIVCSYGTAPVFHVIELTLDDMNLAGKIPTSIQNLTRLQYLELMYNHISGPIPDSIGNLTELTHISFNDNLLTGPLPASLGNLTQLKTLIVPANQLSGSIPDSMQHLHTLETLGLGVNYFTGLIPAWLGNARSLTALDLYFNKFSGQLPDTLCNLNSTLYMELQFNLLHGTVPGCVLNLPKLHFLGLYNNHLSGVLPDAVGVKSPHLQYLELQNNHFHGTIPASYGDLSSLLWLSLQNNTLSGVIPRELNNLDQLSFLSLRINSLTGTIPTAFSQLPALAELLLEHNKLSGDIHNLVDHTTQLNLQTIQLNDNLLTGTIPSAVFQLPQLLTFAAVSNCFSGPLPTTLCSADSLRSLVLDGMTSAESCHRNLFPGVSQSYSLVRSFGGSVPPCLFTLPNITTLHLSGNEFTGTLPNTAFSSSLIDLSLSHNRLHGTIPLHIQSTEWYCLDLSYNQLSGTLDTGVWSDVVVFNKSVLYSRYITDEALIRIQNIRYHNITNNRQNVTHPTLYASLYLENNRLSGRIPGAIQNREDISILGSNMFSCNNDMSNLPTHDSGADRYQCGSDNFNTPYYIWLGLAVVVCVGVCLVLYGYQIGCSAYFTSKRAELFIRLYSFHTYMHFKTPQQNPLSEYGRVISLYEFMLSIAWYCVLFILLALLPLYIVLSAYYGTLTHQYAWAVSAAYISGVVPMVLMLVFLVTLVVGVVCMCMRKLTAERIKARTEQLTVTKTVSVDGGVVLADSTYETYTMYAHNALVYAAFLTINLITVIGVNVAYVYVAIYRNSHVLILSQVLISLFKLVWNNIVSALVLQKASHYLASRNTVVDTRAVETRFTTLLIFIALFNNIVIPCCVVAVVSPNCFYNVFVAAPKVTSTYAYEICALVDRTTGVCNIRLPLLSETSYSPPFTYTYQCSSSLVTYYAPAFLNMCIMGGFVAPVMQFVLYKLHKRAVPGTTMHSVLDRMLARLLKPLHDTDVVTILQHYTPSRPLFKAGRVLIIIYTYLALLLTFGAVFPPLAVAIFVTLCIVATVMRLRVGRFLNSAYKLELTDLIMRIETECIGVGELSVVRNAMWMLVVVCCWFYTLFIFDTLGDSVGFEGAYWVLIVMPLMSLCIYCFTTAFVYWSATDTSGVDDGVATGVVNQLHSSDQEGREVELPIDRGDNSVHSDTV